MNECLEVLALLEADEAEDEHVDVFCVLLLSGWACKVDWKIAGCSCLTGLSWVDSSRAFVVAALASCCISCMRICLRSDDGCV